MKANLLKAWSSINASYWFFPALFSIVALILAFTTIWLDRNGFAEFLNRVQFVTISRPDGAANMLTVIAGSMIGVASTVFSITIAAVAYASGNYGPRLLTNFMEDRGNQVSLGVFIGTFVYSVTVLRTVRAADEATMNPAPDATILPGFVPQLSLLTAFILTMLSVAVLVYFLNHIPSSIRINTVLEGIGKRLMKEIERVYPEMQSHDTEMRTPEGLAVRSETPGYIQIIDYEGLHELAKKEDDVLKLAVRTGDFVHDGRPLAYWADRDRGDDLASEVRSYFALGGMRTPAQDLHFLIDELAEIGMRALSPGINDPFTAITAMHWLGAATHELGKRDLVRKFGRADEASHDHLVLLDDDFEHYVSRGFGAMRSAIAASRTATIVAFDTLYGVTEGMNDEGRRAVVRREGETLFAQTREKLSGPEAHEVEARFIRFENKIDA